MAKALNETEYMYCTARVRSLEMKIPSDNVQNRLLDAVTDNEINSVLREIGVENPSGNYEEELQKLLGKYYDLIESITPEKKVIDIFRYRFDCNNVKSAIKCAHRGLDAESMMFDCGTVDKKTVLEAVLKGNFDCLPKNMSEASKKASEILAKTNNPSEVDTLIDKACYSDMLSDCSNIRIAEWIKLKIDFTNIIAAIRIIRMKLGEVGLSSFEEAFIEGGNLQKQEISVYIEKGEDELLGSLQYGVFSKFVDRVRSSGKDVPLALIEKTADNIYIEKLRELRYVPFGAEIPAGFIEGLEYAVKNIQIILAGKGASLTSDCIRGRLRINYV